MTLIKYYETEAHKVKDYSDETLETKHDYIQYLFPLKTKSLYEDAPTLTEEDIEAFQTPLMQSKLKSSFKIMLTFYGFKTVGNNIVKSSDFDKKAENWLALTSYRNHNMLRISRILKSLSLLGLKSEAKAFFQALVLINQEFPEQTNNSFRYWEEQI